MRSSLLSLTLWAGATLGARSALPLSLETRTELKSYLANIHISRRETVKGDVTYTYGSCVAESKEDSQHRVGTTTDETASRLVWIIPEDAQSGACISGWSSSGQLVARSEPQTIRPLRKRSADTIPMSNASGIDANGPWFDGVALLKEKEPCAVDVNAAKSKEIAIVGAGMSGLMTFLILHQSGLTNLSIIEAGERLGGRVHTVYLSGGPFDYSYQEMGPMRFPTTYTDTQSNKTYNISDQQLVFSLAAEMNKINHHDKNLSVDFIPWLQTSENGLSYENEYKLPTGLPPTLGQISNNASLGPQTILDSATKHLQKEVDKYLPGDEFKAEMAKNMYQAHKDFLEGGLQGLGGDQWSEFAFMVNYLRANLNSTDMLAADGSSFWESLYDDLYFGPSTTFRTINGGLNRLPLSFYPLVDPVTTMNRKIERVKYSDDTQKVTLQWRHNYTDSVFHNASYDYAVIAVPFTVLREWRMPSLPATMTNAISNLEYSYACKVALEYSERFWEHYKNPIYGSCSTVTDIPLIGNICYPSYNINGTGPASMLASYISGDITHRLVGMTEDEHVQYVLDAMTEIHGDFTRDLYTGNYNRRCWALDPLETASWASPSIGQHELYIPEYFKTHSNMIFVGEHTSYTHAWISSALESGVRGAVQMLLELGLVDEAKTANEKWMGRWINV